jgi:hypothetical protein
VTDRERILAAIRGEEVDRIAFVPRLEFWYRARKRSDNLPPEVRSLNLSEIVDYLGVGHYAVVPDFTAGKRETDMLDRALGIYNLPVLPYRVMLEEVDRQVTRSGRETVVEYHTPAGSLRTATTFTEEMLEAGASIAWVTEHAFRSSRDFAVVGHIFAHLRVEPQTEGYLALREEVGERGIVVAWASPAPCPLYHIMKELMPVEEFFYAMYDYPREMQELVEQMEPFYQQIKAIAADSPAEVVLLGANYDDMITPPPFFERHLLPPLRDDAEVLHRKGKLLMSHTDGENRRLLPWYLKAGFDIADSVCPYPMTSCRLEEILEAFADRITIWGGIPSILLCPSSTGEDEFRRFVGRVIERYGRARRLILGVSDMVTADADWSRLRYVADRVNEIR